MLCRRSLAQSYFIHAEEECQALFFADPGEKPDATPALRSLEVPASSVTWSADVASSACSCHVAVEPNRSYTFTVEACNGQRRTLSAPCAPVFAPARVPRPPEAPQVAAQGTLAAELRWSACPFGGGLPLEAFKAALRALRFEEKRFMLQGHVALRCEILGISTSSLGFTYAKRKLLQGKDLPPPEEWSERFGTDDWKITAVFDCTAGAMIERLLSGPPRKMFGLRPQLPYREP
ncbi:unnamed protein product [Effrenium voratum]|nr:unnamed protein product [Effrenium voratum]